MQLTDIGAERAVLAGLYQYGIDCYVEVSEIINCSTFGHQNNQIHFKCVEKVLESESLVDLPSILSAAQHLGFQEIINTKVELEYIHALMQFPIKRENVIKFAVQIKKFEFARHIKLLSQQIGKEIDEINGDETIDEIIQIAEAPLTKLLQQDNANGQTEEISEGIDEYVDFLINNKCDQIGIATGFPRYDQAIGGGLRRKCVDLISARPKAQPLTTKILTPSGWKLMGEVKVGDKIFHPSGTLSTITNIIPQGVRDCFEFNFEGSKTEACADHLWKIKANRWKNYKILSLKDVKRNKSFRDKCGYEWEIPALDNKTKKLTKVISVGLKECQCITIDNPDGLYITDDFIVTHNCGKSTVADNVALNVCETGIPVLMLDTEMSKEDHINRIIANLTNIPIKEIETGKFSEDEQKTTAVRMAIDRIKKLPYTYVSVAGAPFENIINTIKRWIVHTVGKDENGRTRDCVVIYDYLKLMSSSAISNHLQEYQVLGFQITALHNLAVKYDFACLSFVQLNRDGITKETTDAVSGSDRLIWLCTSFSIFKFKSPEEIAQDGPRAGNRKLVPVVCRHGPAMENGNYINVNMIGDKYQVRELRTRDEVLAAGDGSFEGADLPFDINEDGEFNNDEDYD